MTEHVAAITRFRSLFDEVVGSLPGDSVLRSVRERALSAFVERGFPTPRDEDWKYTNLAEVAKRSFAAEIGDGALDAETLRSIIVPDLDAHRMVFVNGKLNTGLSDMQLADTVVTTLATALETNRGVTLDPDAKIHRFAALNTAFVEDGAHLTIPAGATPDKPVYLVFVSAGRSHDVATHPRVRIQAGAGSALTVIEHYAGLAGAANFTNAVTEVSCEAGAVVEHYKIQEESKDGTHIQTLNATIDGDARFVSHNIALGGALARTDVHVTLAGRGGETVLNGLFMPKGRQHIDNHTRIDHLAPDTRSEEDYRGVLDDRGRGVFNGKVVVHENAQKIDAQQSNSNLVLSDQAEIDTKPELEIYADDVKCSHGATIGQLDRDALFYLLSRGIDRKTARDLLTYAFAADIVSRLELLPIRHRLESLIAGRLPESKRIKEFL